METVAQHAARTTRTPITFLNKSDIEALLSKAASKKRRSKNFYVTRTPDGKLARVSGKPPTEEIGQFYGNVGSKRRSRKGRTTTLPNGSRYYVAPYEHEVVMY